MENWSDLVRINMDWINHVQEWLQMFEVAVQMSLLSRMCKETQVLISCSVSVMVVGTISR